VVAASVVVSERIQSIGFRFGLLSRPPDLFHVYVVRPVVRHRISELKEVDADNREALLELIGARCG